MTLAGDLNGQPHTRAEYMRLLYEQAAREQRELAERVRAVRGSDAMAANFERWASDLQRLASPIGKSLAQGRAPRTTKSASRSPHSVQRNSRAQSGTGVPKPGKVSRCKSRRTTA